MKCPSCGSGNIAGDDECAACHEDLTSFDAVGAVLMSDPLARLEPRKPIFVSKGATVLEAVRVMNEAKIGCVLVGDPNSEEGPVGILSERDVALKGVCQGRDLESMPVGALMTPDPETLTDGDSLAYAVNRMSVGGYRHIPILKDGRAVGMISIRDVLRYLARLFP